MDKYKRVKVLGKGSFGHAVLVTFAKDPTKQYVVKEVDMSKMPKSEREASLLEAKLLSALHHPNIVTCYESFTERGRLCIVMDYCAGGDLYQRLKRQKGVLLAEDRILDWFTQMCLGLKHVHDRKVLHRDLKTQNVFMTADGRCKLGDFGVSKVLSGTTQLAQTAVGTPYYLSPEICENKAYDNKSDIWSLGCVLYELCTLQHPFEGASLKLLIVKILRGNYAPVSSRYSRAVRDVIAQMLQRDPARRPSVNEILSRQPFRDMAKRWLDEDVHADEFSHTVIHRKPGSRNAKRTTDPNSKIAGGGVRLSPPRSRPAPYPSGGEGVPTANQKAKPSPPAARPSPSRGGGLIAPSRESRVVTSDAKKPSDAKKQSDPKVAFTPPVHRVAAARGGGVPIWAAHAANMARPYEPVPLPSRLNQLPSRQNPPTHPNFGRAQSATAEAARARREAEEINRRRREQALEERRRKLREEEEARMARRKKADEVRAREREEAEKRRAAEREEARREFLRRQAEARANKQRAQADLGNQPVEVEVLVPKRAVEPSRPSPPRHSAPAAVAAPAGPRATPAATKKRPSPPPSAAPSRRSAERETSSPQSQSSSPPPSQSSSPPRKKPSPDRPDWTAETKTGPGDGESRNPVGGRVAGFVKVGQVTRECSGIDARRRVWEENKAAAERNRERAMTDAVTAVEGVDGSSRGDALGVEVHADANGARVFVDAPTNCVLGATTCEPTELASRIGAMGAPEEGRGGGTPEVDPMAIRAGSALRSGEDDGGDDDGDDDAAADVDTTEVETATAYAAPDRDGDAASSDATSAGRRSKSSKSSKSSEDGALDSTSSLDHDSTFVVPAKFYLDERTVRLRDVDERSTLPDRVEALRVHLERALGEEKFVCAYRALDNLSESDDEDKVVSSLCEVMGEDISYLGLIHQLLVCEDSMHAANEGVEE
mmetsp:Transcript_15041/g.63290  ORF Transcript_15041/g.63290 Transcript_15041/m.63290 type:complete len:943 (+) Transcript_15041:229-3057(+)